MMNKVKVVYIINYAPNYRDVFLKDLGKFVDLTVVSFNGKSANFKDPEIRENYRFVELKQKRFLNVSFNFNEFTEASGDFDVIIVGYNLRNPFRLLNLIRRKRVILEGLMFGKNDNFLVTMIRKFVISFSEGVLVYSQMVKSRLEKEVTKPIISFNNTSYTISQIKKLDFQPINQKLNLLWVGRYQERKKVERLIELARRNQNIELRLIGPELNKNLNTNDLSNVTIFESMYDEELEEHFNWCHAVFNPGGAGLLVMNSGRFARPIFIDNNSHHGPEIQMAIDASQHFIDFSNTNKVDDLVSFCLNNPKELEKLGVQLNSSMKNYTVEYMSQQYLKAIRGEWNQK
jgi:glycosyltransferase involved in cell wall biosynthesis